MVLLVTKHVTKSIDPSMQKQARTTLGVVVIRCSYTSNCFGSVSLLMVDVHDQYDQYSRFFQSLTCQVMSIEHVVELVFLRGMTMQSAVPRDAKGRSSFGMVAANPMRVGPFFDETILASLVEGIAKTTNKLLEIVNYNVRGLQYVVAGHVFTLEVLSETLTSLRTNAALLSDVSGLIGSAISKVTVRAREAMRTGDVLRMKRGTATIPLPVRKLQGWSTKRLLMHLS
jgi:hypothetical protein